MSDLDQRFQEDRQLRDTARIVLMADIAHARTSLSAKGVAGRVGGRIGDGAKDVFEVAKVHSDDNRGIIAALIGAVLLWFAREPILEILGLSKASDDSETAESNADLPRDPDPDTGERGPEFSSATNEPLPPGDNDEQ